MIRYYDSKSLNREWFLSGGVEGYQLEGTSDSERF